MTYNNPEIEPMTVEDAIRASNRAIAQRWNRHSKRLEYAAPTGAGIRIIKSVTDWTVVRKLRSAELLTRGWTPWMCTHPLGKAIGGGKIQCCQCGETLDVRDLPSQEAR